MSPKLTCSIVQVDFYIGFQEFGTDCIGLVFQICPTVSFFYAQNRKQKFQNKFYGLLNNPIIKKTAPEKKTVKDRAIFGVQ